MILQYKEWFLHMVQTSITTMFQNHLTKLQILLRNSAGGQGFGEPGSPIVRKQGKLQVSYL